MHYNQHTRWTSFHMIITSYYSFIFRYIRPQFFYNNPLLSFIQLVIGPYTDDLGNVLPYAVEGVGVRVDPLAFAGLLGGFVEISIFVPLFVPTIDFLQVFPSQIFAFT